MKFARKVLPALSRGAPTFALPHSHYNPLPVVLECLKGVVKTAAAAKLLTSALLRSFLFF